MKTIRATQSYRRKHISFFLFMMLLMLIIYGKASAQEQQTASSSSHLRIGVGYGFPSGSQLVDENSSYTSSTSSSEGIYGTLGTGLTFNAAYMHMYSKNIGLDLNLQYLMGKKYEGTHSSSYNGSTFTSTTSMQSRGVLFSPSLIVRVGEKKVKPYVQVGLVMGKINVNEEYNSPTTQSITEYKGGLSFGFKGGFGIDAAISQKTIFFTELVFTSMSYFPKESTRVSVSNGTRREETTEYVKEGNMNDSGSSSTTLSGSFPFGSVALNVGLKFQLKSKNKS